MLCPRLIHNDFRPLSGALFSFVPYTCLMTSSIPDGLSFAELQAMMAVAANKEARDNELLTEEEISRIVIKATRGVAEEIGDVSAFKHLAMYSLHKLFEFHNEVSLQTMSDEDEHDKALCWGRDAGWIQVCLNTLRNVHCGPQDYWFDKD